MGYRADLESQLKKAPNRLYSKKDPEMASQFISAAIKDSFEKNCPIKQKNSLTQVPWWNKELSKLRIEVTMLFNRARITRKVGDWESLQEAQRAYRKAIIVTKRKSWTRFFESTENVSHASRPHRILNKENKPRLGCIKLPSRDYTELVEGL
jgi:hypothetical protein